MVPPNVTTYHPPHESCSQYGAGNVGGGSYEGEGIQACFSGNLPFWKVSELCNHHVLLL